jgi:hypothetical protein
MGFGAAVVSGGWPVAIASVFVWLGMVLAISFLEAPLKFRAPGVTLQVGLGIGRLVFRALNVCELVLAVIIVGSFLVRRPPVGIVVAATVAFVTLLAQVLVVRPALTRRSDAVLAGADEPRSRGHYAYIGLELIKAISLLVAGILLLIA